MLYKAYVDSKKFNLADILASVLGSVSEYRWTIFEFDGCLAPMSKFDFNEISDAAIEKKSGVEVNYGGLLKLASDISQTYDLVLAGSSGEIKEFSNTDSWREGNKITVEMVDCGDWEIYSNDSKLESKIKNRLR
jgi:hypothetical protein